MVRIIFFDGHCRICNGFSKSILKIDRNRIFQFASLHSKTAQQLLSAQDLGRDSVVYYEDAKTYTETAAVIRILQQLGGFYKLLAQFIEIVPRPLRDTIYRGIARIRYSLQFKKPLACDITQMPRAESAELNTASGQPRFLL